MYRKVVLLIMLTLFFIGFITLATDIKSAKSEPELANIVPIKHKGFIDPLMDWYTVVGVLLNNGSDYATDIKVRCVFRNADGELLTVKEETIYRGGFSSDKLILPPGWVVPFEVTVTDTELSQQIASYEISVTCTILAGVPKTNSLFFKEISFHLSDRNELFEYETWVVAGIIRNLGDKNATDAKVQVIFLGSNGEPLGYGGNSFEDVQPEPSILPGAESYFSIETRVPIYSDITSVILIIESDEYFGCYPTLPFTSTFSADWETRRFSITVTSNSSVGNLVFDQPTKTISFLIAGENGTKGFCNITIPKELLWCENIAEWIVKVNGNAITYQAVETLTHTSLYFTYQHSVKTVEITATNVIPEFPPSTLMLLLLTLVTISVLVKRKFQRKRFN